MCSWARQPCVRAEIRRPLRASHAQYVMIFAMRAQRRITSQSCRTQIDESSFCGCWVISAWLRNWIVDHGWAHGVSVVGKIVGGGRWLRNSRRCVSSTSTSCTDSTQERDLTRTGDAREQSTGCDERWLGGTVVRGMCRHLCRRKEAWTRHRERGAGPRAGLGMAAAPNSPDRSNAMPGPPKSDSARDRLGTQSRTEVDDSARSTPTERSAAQRSADTRHQTRSRCISTILHHLFIFIFNLPCSRSHAHIHHPRRPPSPSRPAFATT
jgi:hypothetical protein